MDPQELLAQLLADLTEMLAQEVLDWPGLQDKVKAMRDVIGPNLPQPVLNPYGQIIVGVNPGDMAIVDWTLSQVQAWRDFCAQSWPPQ